MSEDRQVGVCPECGAGGVQLTKAGRLFKHDAGDGTCEGSGGGPAVDILPDLAPDASGSEELGEDDDWPADGDRESPTPSDPAETPAEPPVDDLGYGKAAYSWQMTVRQPAIYLDDKAWHFENAKAAAKAAEQAGHTPAGEAQCTAVVSTEDGSGLVLTYTLPIDTPGDPRG